MGKDFHHIIQLALPVQRIVEVTSKGPPPLGRCIACQETGFLKFRYGTLWRPKSSRETELIHLHLCPVNRLIINQKQ